MGKHKLILIVKTVKYISILSLIFFIVFNTDVLINFTTGDIQYFLKSIVTFVQTHPEFTSVILFINLAVIAISNFIIHHIKLDDKNNQLTEFKATYENKIDNCQRTYNSLDERTKDLEESLKKSKSALYKNTNSKIQKLSEHSVKLETHFEVRKSNYFYTNQKFYCIVKMSRQIDSDTLQLINTFEKEISK